MRRLKIIQDAHPRGERGAVAVITALVVSFVVLGMLALTIDVGAMTWERSQLQNAADASVLVLAQECAAGSTICADGNSQLEDKLQPLLDRNSYQDGHGQLAKMALSGGSPYTNGYCGRGVPSLEPCVQLGESAWTNLQECPPLAPGLPANVPYVQTYAMTKVKNGTNLLKAWFSTDVEGTTHVTCARAAWMAAGGTGTTLPIVMGKCEWLTKKKDEIAPPPPYSPPPANSKPAPPSKDGKALKDYAIGLQAHADGPEDADGSPEDCRRPDQTNGQYFPGGFGWLATNGNCKVTVNADSWVDAKPGEAVPTGCDKRWDGGNGNAKDANNVMAPYVGTTVFLPIVDDWDANYGAHGGYHVEGVVAFFLAGFVDQPTAGTYEKYAQPATKVCNSKCFWGWFTSGVLPLDAAGGSGGALPDFGAEQVYPVG